MLKTLFYVSALSAVALASPINLAACPFPNGTHNGMHTYECASGKQITINSIDVTDVDGKPMYPVDPKKAFVLNLHTFNHGVAITDNKVNVKIFDYATSWFSKNCTWNEIPTLGLLDGIDGCNFAHNCPLTSGDLTLKIKLDLSQFSAIIDMLAANKPYELEISMTNWNAGDNAHEEIACVMAQMQIL